MQQLCLTGRDAGLIADRLFNALNLRPVGLRIAPFMLHGVPMGDALHLLPPPALNGVPCRIRLTPEDSVIVERALTEVAVPGLKAAMQLRSPLLLDGLRGDMLSCEPFMDAVCQCLMSLRPVVVTADAPAAALLRARIPEERQLWFDVPEDPSGQSALLETLVPEAALRL